MAENKRNKHIRDIDLQLLYSIVIYLTDSIQLL